MKEWKFILKRISESPLAVTGIAIIFGFLIIACLAPILAPPQGPDPFIVPQDIEIATLTPNPTPPSTRHIFGTTDQQYDIYYACIWGTISAFRVGLSVIIIALLIGLVIGTLSAYYGGIIDEILMRITDIIIAFPGLLLAMVMAITFPTVLPLDITLLTLIITAIFSLTLIISKSRRKLLLAILAVFVGDLFLYIYNPIIIPLNLSKLDKVLISLALVSWPGYARLIRSEVLRVKSEDFVEAAKVAGCSTLRIIVKHIWPNTIYSLIIVSTLDIGSIVLTAAALSFLGIGAEPNFADWGQIISRSRNWISRPDLLVANYHTFLIPGIFITLFVLGWNLLGDALRDVLDPMIRRR
ncbi:MAG: ABC transporter permease [Candidatus Bathyarchaeia archaeon]